MDTEEGNVTEHRVAQQITNGDDRPEGSKPPRPKKPYQPPVLVDYGSIAKLTQAGGASAADGPVGFMMNCL